MDIRAFKRVAPVLFRNRVVPFLWGSQGLGKTDVVRQVADSLDHDFIHLHMANLEVGDLVGLLVKRDDGTVYHARPEWFPVEGCRPTIIFLDELNRMHPDVMQAMFSFITSGTIHTHKLPSNCAIAAAGNYGDSGSFQVTDTSDEAWMSRFCHIDFKPTLDEFTLYADKQGAALLADFVREHSNMLEKSTEQRFDFTQVTPDRRSWLRFVQPLELEAGLSPEDRYELYQGLVGPAAAAAYMTYKKTAEKSLSLKLILSNYKSQRPKVLDACQGSKARFDYLNKPVAELLTNLADNKEYLSPAGYLTNLKSFLLDIPLELSQRVFKDIAKLDFVGKSDLLNDMTFCQQIAEKAG